MLTIKNLSHTYPNGVQALNNINLEISKGMFGLLGPNGAGKSSLMRTVAALQQPSTGEIYFGDVNVITEPDKLRRVLGYLPQEFGVYPRGSAQEILNHIAVLKGFGIKQERKKVVESLLKLTNLYQDRKKRVATFSGGMHQRFGIALALIGNPQLLIVDEPTAGLDPEERNRFYNLLSEISEDVVVILSTHIVEDVGVLCPNMAVMLEGKVITQGSSANLIQALEGKIWGKVIDKIELEIVKTNHRVLSSHFKAGSMVARVLDSDCPGAGFEQVPSTLEDVYFSAVHGNHHHCPSIEKKPATKRSRMDT